MLETTLGDGTQQLGLEQEITEARCVDADVGALGLFLLVPSSSAVFGASISLGLDGLLILFVVDQVLNFISTYQGSERGGEEQQAERIGLGRQTRQCVACAAGVRIRSFPK